MSDIGNNIRRIRKEKGLTQKQLGERCNPPLADSSIRRYEAGSLVPKYDMVLRIANALDVSVFALLDLSDENTVNELNSIIPYLDALGYKIFGNIYDAKSDGRAMHIYDSKTKGYYLVPDKVYEDLTFRLANTVRETISAHPMRYDDEDT